MGVLCQCANSLTWVSAHVRKTEKCRDKGRHKELGELKQLASASRWLIQANLVSSENIEAMFLCQLFIYPAWDLMHYWQFLENVGYRWGTLFDCFDFVHIHFLFDCFEFYKINILRWKLAQNWICCGDHAANLLVTCRFIGFEWMRWKLPYPLPVSLIDMS